jgi:hypothetical protein
MPSLQKGKMARIFVKGPYNFYNMIKEKQQP